MSRKSRQQPTKSQTQPQREAADSPKSADIFLGEEVQKDLIETIVRRVSIEFSGPLPPPATLKGYEDALPGLAERIVQMAEKEQAHRHMIDQKIVGLFSRGQWLGFVLGVLGIIAGVWLIQAGYDLGGLGALLISLGFIISALLFGSRKPKALSKNGNR